MSTPSSVGDDRLVLEVEEEVAALLRALGTGLELGDEAGEREVQVRRLLGLAGDDQRRPRLVDEDVVDLVDDRERALALHPAVELVDHVVAQVVEAELVVRAVGDVGGVGLAPGDGAEVDQPLVGGREAGLEQVARVVGDDADRQPEEVEDGPHPLGVAAGQVVVDGHEVGAAPAEAVERQGEGRDEGLALARLHLGDLALVEDDAADELDVEVAHAQRPLARLAGGGEHLGRDLVEGGPQPLVLALAAGLAEVAATLRVGVVELVVGRLVARRDLVHLGLDDLDPLADLVVGEGLELVLELVDLVHDRLEAADLAVVGVEESGDEAHGRVSIWRVAARPGFGARARGVPAVSALAVLDHDAGHVDGLALVDEHVRVDLDRHRRRHGDGALLERRRRSSSPR